MVVPDPFTNPPVETPDGCRARIHLPSGHRYFDGHFVDRPLCPGVGLLDCVDRALARTHRLRTAGYAEVRFKRPILPDVTAELAIDGLGSERPWFTITSAEGLHAQGAVRIEGRAGNGHPSPGPPPERNGHGLPVRLPHRPPSLLIESVQRFDADSIDVVGRVPSANGLVRRDHAPAVLAVEIGAQAGGCHAAWNAAPPGSTPAEPAPGFLVAIANAHWHADDVPPEVDIVARVTRLRVLGPMTQWRVDAWRDATPWASAQFATFGLLNGM